MDNKMAGDCLNSNRSPGLDVVRTLAISGVLAAHATLFLEPLGWSLPSLLPVHIWGGFLGVELFFALSGFLIGKILFRTVLPAPSWHSSYVFLLRRWMRTLPAYYTVLVVLFFYAALTNTLPDDWLEYIVFTQNAPPEYARFFPVSWSLSIEQWAYIWILIFLLPGAGIGAFLRRRFGWHKGSEFFWGALLICGIVASLFLRIWHASDPSASWDNDFRKQVGLRLDAVLFGVLAAWIKIYAHLFYKMIARNIFFVFVILFFLLQCFDMSIFTEQNNIFFKTLAFTLVDGCCALLLCFFDDNEKIRQWFSIDSLPGKFVFYGSSYAYSLYLIHLSVFNFIQKILISFVPVSYLIAVVFLLLSVLFSLCLAFILSHVIEKPCMELRQYFLFKK